MNFIGMIMVSVIWLSGLAPALSRAWKTEKRLIPFPEWASSFSERDEIQLELVEIKVAGRPVTLGQPFEAGDDWLTELTFRVRNVSPKPIAAFGIGGGLLNGVGEELPSRASFRYGIGWGWGTFFDPEGESAALSLEPGETVELSFANVDREYRRALARQEKGAFSKLKFMAPSVQYTDGKTVTSPKMRFPAPGKT